MKTYIEMILGAALAIWFIALIAPFAYLAMGPINALLKALA